MLIVKSHTYTIVMDNCAYFRSGRPHGTSTIFKMLNGRDVQITCDYDTVIKQISHHYSFGIGSKAGNHFITLKY